MQTGILAGGGGWASPGVGGPGGPGTAGTSECRLLPGTMQE